MSSAGAMGDRHRLSSRPTLNVGSAMNDISAGRPPPSRRNGAPRTPAPRAACTAGVRRLRPSVPSGGLIPTPSGVAALPRRARATWLLATGRRLAASQRGRGGRSHLADPSPSLRPTQPPVAGSPAPCHHATAPLTVRPPEPPERRWRANPQGAPACQHMTGRATGARHGDSTRMREIDFGSEGWGFESLLVR